MENFERETKDPSDHLQLEESGDVIGGTTHGERKATHLDRDRAKARWLTAYKKITDSFDDSEVQRVLKIFSELNVTPDDGRRKQHTYGLLLFFYFRV